MEAVADLERRFGVGWGGLLLYFALFFAGAAVVATLGDLPTGYGRRSPPRVLVPGVAYALGLVGVTLATSNLPTYARLALTDDSGTGDAARADGRVVVRGSVDSAGGTLSTPFRGAEAVAYTTRVLTNAEDDAETARSSEENWRAVHVGEATTPFAVDDGSGRVRVDPEGARLSLGDREHQMVPAGEELPATVREYLATTDVQVDAADEHARFEEAALEPGEEAFVMGGAEAGTVEATLLAEGDHAARIRRRVHWGGGAGFAAAALGYLGLLLVAGVP